MHQLFDAAASACIPPAIFRRRAIYEELHPETKHGGDRKSDQVAEFATRFSANTSQSTGKSERSVQIAAARGEALGDDLSAVAGTLRGKPHMTIEYGPRDENGEFDIEAWKESLPARYRLSKRVHQSGEDFFDRTKLWLFERGFREPLERS